MSVSTAGRLTTTTGGTLNLQTTAGFANADVGIQMLGADITNSSGTFNGVAIRPIYTTTGSAAATDIFSNRSTISVGSGEQNLMDLQDTNVSKFKVDTGGTTKLSIDSAGLIGLTPIVGITADTGSSQGDGPLTASVNEISGR